MSLFGPVLARELDMLSRSKRQFFLRALYLIALISPAAIFMPDVFSDLFTMGLPDDLSTMGAILFYVLAWAQLSALALFTPLLTAPVVASERENDTLGLLVMTPMRTAHILLDKLASRLTVLVLFLLSGLPVFIILLAFGGVEPLIILWTYIHIFSALVLCCGIGLLASVWANTTTGALAAAYIGLAILGLVLFLGEATLRGTPGIFPLAFYRDHVFSYNFKWPGQPKTPCWPFPVLAWLIFLFTLCRSLVLLPKVALQPRQSRLRAGLQRLNRFLDRINFTHVRVLRESVPMGKHPLVWLETNKQVVCSRSFRLRFIYILIIVWLPLAFIWGGVSEDLTGYIHFHTLAVTVMTVLVASQAVIRERDQATHDMLLLTPITGREWFLAKLTGVWTAVSPLVWIPFLMPLPFLAIWSPSFWSQGWGTYVVYVLSLLTMIPVTMVISMAISLVSRTLRQAVLRSSVVFAAWYGVPWLLHYLESVLWNSYSYVHLAAIPYVRRALALAPPVFWCSWSRLAHMTSSHGYYLPEDYWWYRLTQGQAFNWWAIMALSIVITLVLAGLIFWFLLVKSERLYRRSLGGGRR